ncbi:MAG: putative zinc-binding metallopeptidase [Steroidobacteraceae bacterium]
MKTFQCDVCSGPLFFENNFCGHCELPVGYFPGRRVMATLKGDSHRRCKNFEVQNVCNWMVPADDPEPFCQSCRLTHVIPDLTQPQNHDLWYRTEAAKRRLIYTLLDLGLPVVSRAVDPEHGLAFEFRADEPGPEGAVLTGHDDGVITLNIAEADDAEREQRRIKLHEPYRTLLGHFRHEIGHYYWDVLIRDGARLQDFRRLFGDETADYGEALRHHYEQGAAPDWPNKFVSSYASSHPWEDWAETWAHYLHMVDSLDTAAASGIALHAPQFGNARLRIEPLAEQTEFDQLMKSWLALTIVLNNLNRSMGLQDAYPFVLPNPAVDKLRFVHEIVTGLDPAELATPSFRANTGTPATSPS